MPKDDDGLTCAGTAGDANPELRDSLSKVTTSLAACNDTETAEFWMQQADRLVRQYCRLGMVPQTESAVAEDLRSFCIIV